MTGGPGVGFVDGNSNQSNGSRNSDEMLHSCSADQQQQQQPAREPPPTATTGSAEKKTPGERRRKRKNQDALEREGGRGGGGGGGGGGLMDGGVKPQAAKKINEYFPRNAPGSPGAQAQGKSTVELALS